MLKSQITHKSVIVIGKQKMHPQNSQDTSVSHQLLWLIHCDMVTAFHAKDKAHSMGLLQVFV